MECKTFRVEIAISYNENLFKNWSTHVEYPPEPSETPERWIAPNPYLSGKMLVVDGEIYGVLEEAVSKEKRFLRGVVIRNCANHRYGLGFYALPTIRNRSIDMYLITDLDEPRHNIWTSRGLFDWFSPRGKVKLTLEETPYGVDALMQEINEISGLANKTSKTNQKTAHQMEMLKTFFHNVTLQFSDKMPF